MNANHLKQLEAVAVVRNPLLENRLQPGLSEQEISVLLKLADIKGAIQSIIQLYCWKNGTLRDSVLAVSKTGLFPCSTYNLSELKRAIADMKALKDYWIDFPKLSPLVRRYFPAFWDGDSSWIALDLESSDGRVVLIRLSVKKASLQDGRYEPQIREINPPREAYTFFVDFVADAIRANVNNEELACFRMDKEPIYQPTPTQLEPLNDTRTPNAWTAKDKGLAIERAFALRTDFSDEGAWKSLCAAIRDTDAGLNFINDAKYDGVTPDQLPLLLPQDSSLAFVFILDRIALLHPEHPILIVDLLDTPGRAFRAIISEIKNIESNLSIANMGFDEFAEAVGHDGIFRGFSHA
jgi:hypothetical protein